MKISVLSGGRDASGIDAVIRAVVRRGIQCYNDEVIGIRARG